MSWRALGNYFTVAKRSQNEDAKIVYTRHLSTFLKDLAFEELAKRAWNVATAQEADEVLSEVERLLRERGELK